MSADRQSSDGADRQSPGDQGRAWRRFGIALGVGVIAVFLYEIVGLVRTLLESSGVERGAVWAILLMILVTFLAVGLIGGGLARAIRRAGRGETTGEPGRGHGERSAEGAAGRDAVEEVGSRTERRSG